MEELERKRIVSDSDANLINPNNCGPSNKGQKILSMGLRPMGGVKFSKSAACLNLTLSTGFTGDDTASTTSAIETQSQMAARLTKFSDFTVVASLG